MYFRILLIFLLIFSTHHYDVMAKSKAGVNNYVFTSEKIFTDGTKLDLNQLSNSLFKKKKILLYFVSYKNNCHLQKVKKQTNKNVFYITNAGLEVKCLYNFAAKIRSKLLANEPKYIDKSIIILIPPAPSEVPFIINFGDAWEKKPYIDKFFDSDDHSGIFVPYTQDDNKNKLGRHRGDDGDGGGMMDMGY